MICAPQNSIKGRFPCFTLHTERKEVFFFFSSYESISPSFSPLATHLAFSTAEVCALLLSSRIISSSSFFLFWIETGLNSFVLRVLRGLAPRARMNRPSELVPLLQVRRAATRLALDFGPRAPGTT